jgi:3-hydroxyisobutyrate dehydrogenase-like beta-hydroxyacid dehydrogenase
MVIGFLGFGEAGFTIGRGLASAGCQLVSYDINRRDPARGSLIERRASESGATLVDSNAELARNSHVILSTVTCSAALDAARQTAPFLTADHVYADLNSVSPSLKQQIGAVIESTGARYVEVAVMAPVAPYGHKVPMLLGGRHAALFAQQLSPLGMRLEALPAGEIGAAAAVKMCRSVIVKGLEALMFECVMAASQYGADGHVLKSLDDSYPGLDWKKLADYMVNRVVVHGERRAREMDEVAETLQAIGVEPIMAEATARRQQWAATLGLRSHFGADGPATYRQVLDVIYSQAHK